MFTRSVFTGLVCYALIAGSVVKAQQDYDGPILIEGIAVAGDIIVFSVGGDIFEVDRTGGSARPISRSSNSDQWPVISPDGSKVAYTRANSGRGDLFVFDRNTAEERQVTFHPEQDVPTGFSPDSGKLLFASARDNALFHRLYELELEESPWPVALNLPSGSQGVYSPDGETLFFTPKRYGTFSHRFNYRGGAMARLHGMALPDGVPQAVTDPSHNSYWPVVTSHGLAYVSDENSVLNVYLKNLESGETTQITQFSEIGVRGLAGDETGLIYEHDGHLYTMDWASRVHQQIALSLDISSSLSNSYIANAAAQIETAAFATDGSAVITARGELFSTNVNAMAVSNVSGSKDAREVAGAISVDGEYIAYFEDGSGEYRLAIANADGTDPARFSIEQNPGFYDHIKWSSNNRYLAFSDHRLSAWVFDRDEQRFTRIARSSDSAQTSYEMNWSPGGRYLAYSLHGSNSVPSIYIYDVVTNQSNRVTSEYLYAGHPLFDLNGEYLYFTLSTTRKAVDERLGFALSSRLQASPASRNRLYVVGLRADAEVPFNMATQQANPRISLSAASVDGNIDWQGIEDRIIQLPTELYNVDDMVALEPGRLAISNVEWPGNPVLGSMPSKSLYLVELFNPTRLRRIATEFTQHFAVNQGQGLVLTREAPGLRLLQSNGGNWETVEIQPFGLPAEIEPRQEWAQMYFEAWRIIREHFYDPNYHGYDLTGLSNHYARFLPGIQTRAGFTALMRRISDHLSISHARVGTGDMGFEQYQAPNVGLLGADFELDNNRYRIDKIYRMPTGRVVNATSHAPLDVPNRVIREGLYLTGVNGREIFGEQNLYWYFRGLGDRVVTLTLSENPDGSDAFQFQTRTSTASRRLRRVAWGTDRQQMARESADNIGYISIDMMRPDAIEDFMAGFYALSDEKGLIIDIRNNGGGTTIDSVLNLLARKPAYSYLFRNGSLLSIPANAFDGHLVLLINSHDHSAAETFPFMFKLSNIGTIVGERTAGGLNGGYGYRNTLMDGGVFQFPSRASLDPATGFLPENTGIAPDIEIEFDTIAWREGRDNQLEAAIELISSLPARQNSAVEAISYPVHREQ